jgi:hypothetical protein
LSLSNEPQKLIDMTLDALPHVLNTECCWVQTINAGRKRSLRLAAGRGFTPDMQAEMSAMDISDDFTRQIIGLGNKLVIPDLSHDGRYGLASFRSAGYKWLVAVPLMTYRVHGVLGIASRNKGRLHKETPDLVMAIAGLIGTALNIAGLSQKSHIPEKAERAPDIENRQDPATPPEESATLPDNLTAAPDVTDKKALKPGAGTFHKHLRNMKSFRSLHH